MNEAVSAYLATLTGGPSRRLAARDWLKVFTRYCELRQLDWTALTLADLLEYQRTLRWEPSRSGRLYASATVVQALAQLRHFLRWAQANGRLAHDPSQGLVLGKVTYSCKTLTAAQLIELVRAPDPTRPMGLRDALVLELVMTLELGLMRCLALDLADVPRLPALVRLEPYLREGRPALAHDPREPALLLDQQGARLSYGRAQQIPGQYGRRLGWPGVCAQVLVRSFRAHQAAFSARLFSL